jgi:hypothetical protein
VRRAIIQVPFFLVEAYSLPAIWKRDGEQPLPEFILLYIGPKSMEGRDRSNVSRDRKAVSFGISRFDHPEVVSEIDEDE